MVLQQFPNVLPKHVYPDEPPQDASVDTFLVDVGAADETFVLLTGATEDEAGFTELDPPVLLPQFPNPDWHPVPQYSVVEPHHPFALQQLPKELPRHVYPELPPHVASGETFFAAAEGVAAADVARALTGLLLPQFPKPD